jgi:protein subunit release factor A
VHTILELEQAYADIEGIIELAREENDQELLDEALLDLNKAEEKLEELEKRRMFSGEMDANNAYLDIQAGSGGTEAQDWAEMIMRMYLRWGEQKGFNTELVESTPGEGAGIKVNLPLAGYVPRPVCIVWSGNRLLIRVTAGIPHSPRSLSRRKSMMILISTWI